MKKINNKTKKAKMIKKVIGSLVLVCICLALAVLALVIFMAPLILSEIREVKKAQTVESKKVKLWQKFLAKDPNEDELWSILNPGWRQDNEEWLRKCAAYELVNKTKSEERLTKIINVFDDDKELRTKAADRLLANPSVSALKTVLDSVPERAEYTFSLLKDKNDPNIFDYSCLVDVIRNVPPYRKWAWKRIIANPCWITGETGFCFGHGSFPEEAVNLYFNLNLESYHYRYIIEDVNELRQRAWKEFISKDPDNEDVEKIYYWSSKCPDEIRVLAARYVLENNPSEEHLKDIKEKFPSLNKEVKKIFEQLEERKLREKEARSKTKEGILQEMRDLQ